MQLRTLLAIVVRLKSERLSKKAVKNICEKPMISHLIDRLKTSKNYNELVLCTSTNKEDTPLIEVAKQNKIKYFRGSELDVLLRLKDAAEEFNCQIIVAATGDNPLTDPEYIDKMIKEMQTSNIDFLSALKLPIGTFAYSIKLDSVKKVIELKKEEDTEIWGQYFTKTNIFKTKDLEINPEHQKKYRLTVDTPEDFKVVEKIYNELYQEGKVFSLSEIIDFLDNHPEITQINQKVIQRTAPQIDKEEFEDKRIHNAG